MVTKERTPKLIPHLHIINEFYRHGNKLHKLHLILLIFHFFMNHERSFHASGCAEVYHVWRFVGVATCKSAVSGTPFVLYSVKFTRNYKGNRRLGNFYKFGLNFVLIGLCKHLHIKKTDK